MKVDTRELRNLQTYNNFSNKEISYFLDISVSTFVNLKMNRYKWKDEYIKRLCKLFDIKEEDLFNG
jgi:hypothetical protein